jgi:hypothetical protein
MHRRGQHADESVPGSRYLSVNEAARTAHLSYRVVVKAIARGQLSAIMGHPAQPNTWVVHSNDLQTWLVALA